MVKKKMASSNERPVGVTILAVLAYIGAAFSLLGGIALLAGSAAVSSVIDKVAPQLAAYAGFGTALFIFLGIILLACAVLNYYIGKGLWNGRNWARIVLMVLCGLNVLGSLWPINIVGLAINGLIIWYIGFYKPVVAYFK